MSETREERQVMIGALKHEIASAEAAIESLEAQAEVLANVSGPGAETRLLRIQHSLAEQKKAVKAAGEQLALRVGGGAAVKRGPGRPPKSVSEARASEGFPELPDAKPSDSAKSSK